TAEPTAASRKNQRDVQCACGFLSLMSLPGTRKEQFRASLPEKGKVLPAAAGSRALRYNQRSPPEIPGMRTVVYPGTFNPITNGHTDLIERAAGIFDRVIVAVGTSTQKQSAVSLDKRVRLCSTVLEHLPNVEVLGFRGLLTDFVREQGANL